MEKRTDLLRRVEQSHADARAAIAALEAVREELLATGRHPSRNAVRTIRRALSRRAGTGVLSCWSLVAMIFLVFGDQPVDTVEHRAGLAIMTLPFALLLALVLNRLASKASPVKSGL